MTEAERNAIIEECASMAQYIFEDAMPRHELGPGGLAMKMCNAIRALASDPVKADLTGGERQAAMSVMCSLAAAISLLERTPSAKQAAPSDKMFHTMLADYKRALETARTTFASDPVKAEHLPRIGLPYNLAELIEEELNAWRGMNGGIYTVHACALAVSIKLRALASDPFKATDAWLDEMVQPGSTGKDETMKHAIDAENQQRQADINAIMHEASAPPVSGSEDIEGMDWTRTLNDDAIMWSASNLLPTPPVSGDLWEAIYKAIMDSFEGWPWAINLSIPECAVEVAVDAILALPQIKAQDEALDVAVKTLEPLADVAGDIPEDWSNKRQCMTMCGHFRSARAALAKIKELRG